MPAINWARLASVCLLALGRLVRVCLLDLLALVGWMLHGHRGQLRLTRLLLLLVLLAVAVDACGLGHLPGSK